MAQPRVRHAAATERNKYPVERVGAAEIGMCGSEILAAPQ
jgi:hypothetical protein